ncbi:MAG: hypothetical protein NTU44_08655 [Bacteroidetes bacterium]|nr:hypothetical protein [Bacteroidota bacterium]
MMVLPALENVLLLIFILLTVYFFRKPASKPLFWFMLFFFISVFTLTGLITPVMGAMVRYRTPALPFLFASILMLWDKDRFPEWPLIVKLKNLL